MPDDSRVLVLPSRDDVVAEALEGLLQTPKTLPPKLFYDEAGCALFQRITELPEYYPTRTERALLASVASRITGATPPGSVLVEYGASDEGKADLLLREPGAFAAYVPIDVAPLALEAIRGRLARARPALTVRTIAADFRRPLALPSAVAAMPRLGFFPGSTIGNLEPSGAQAFLDGARATLGRGARFLVGVDLRKDPAVLVPAYDDAAGVTAAFNRNLLVRLNREAAADFDPASFAHRAIWNAGESRIEMHLVSRLAQMVHVAGEEIRFARGETIHTENSYKHTLDGFAALAGAAGWTACERWTDAGGLFSLHLLVADGD